MILSARPVSQSRGSDVRSYLLSPARNGVRGRGTTKIGAGTFVLATDGDQQRVEWAMAIAEELKRSDPATEITFLGRRHELKNSLIEKSGYRWKSVMAATLRRPVYAFPNVIVFMKGLIAGFIALVRLLTIRPSAVVSLGGPEAWMTGFIAYITRTPMVVVEPNVMPGGTARNLAHMARLVFTAFKVPHEYLRPDKTRMVGVPLAENPKRPQRSEARKQMGVTDSELVVTVVEDHDTAACTSNKDALEQVCASLRKRHANLRLMNQDGNNLVAGARPAEVDATPPSDATDMAEAPADSMTQKARLRTQLAGSDLVIARPTASMCGELLAAAAPALLMPRKVREDFHDRFNAQAMEVLGVARTAPCAVIGGVDSLEDDAAEDSTEEEQSASEATVASDLALASGHDNTAAHDVELSQRDAAEALQLYGPGKRAQRLLQTEHMISALLSDSSMRGEMERRAKSHGRDQAARVVAEALIAVAEDPKNEDVGVLAKYKAEALQRTIAIATRITVEEKAKGDDTMEAHLAR